MGSAPLLSVRSESRNGVASLALAGELDLSTVTVLEGHLACVEGVGITSIMLDLRELTFLDCSGLNVFLAARSRATTNGHQLILVGVGARSRRLFELAGTEFLLDDRYAAGVIDRFNQTADSLIPQTPDGMVDSDG